MKMTIYCLAFVMMFSVSCMGWGFTAKGVDNSKKESNFGVNTKLNTTANLDTEVTGVKAKEMKNTGFDNSKKIGVQHTEGVDMETLMYIMGGFFTLMTGLITKMFIQLAEKDKIILDLGNDSKEILLKIIPMFILMHDKEAYETFAKYKLEKDIEIDRKIKEALTKPKKKGWFGKKKEV